MKKALIGIVIILILGAAGWYVFGQAKQGVKVYHVGILQGLSYFASTTEAFKAKMTSLGYIEGKNIVYDLQMTNFEPDKEKAILQRFVANNDDLIFTFPTEVSIFAKQIKGSSTIPLVFANAAIEDLGVIDSIAKPGNNLTGVRFPGTDLAIERLKTLVAIDPKAKKILVPYLKDYPIVPPQLRVLAPVATALNVTLIEKPFVSPDELQTYLNDPKTPGTFDAILIIAEPLTVVPAGYLPLSHYAEAHHIPLGGTTAVLDDPNYLFNIVPEPSSAGMQVALMADKIFKGVPAGTIPVASPETVVIINYKAATKFGLTIPHDILNIATAIIK